MKIFLINENDREREWLTSALKMTSQIDTVICLGRGYELEVEECSFSTAFIIVTQEQFPALRRQLSKYYSAKELPCPILILSESFDSFDVSGYRHFTLDAFPTDALTPQILKYLLSTLRRDFKKDVRLKRLAHYDTLTGATNRYLFSDRTKQAIAAARRQNEPLAFMYFDLDKFKEINDKYGHNTGDEYLKTFVEVVQSTIRDSDTFGRLGGDEFALLLPKSYEVDAVKKARQILAELDIKQDINGHILSIATAIGIVSFAENDLQQDINYKTIVGYADKAAFASKKKGKHKYSVYRMRVGVSRKPVLEA
ncbi:diguanylate cyclase domain-containing protein [Glaciecola sp. SC05]|uniref:diguanylate cyclase domain-containing protein n=1 Tax=Glaciecola sp. SC05 TaxID=1987355 RepID=UPI003527B66D